MRTTNELTALIRTILTLIFYLSEKNLSTAILVLNMNPKKMKKTKEKRKMMTANQEIKK